jgi:hypothetical protein
MSCQKNKINTQIIEIETHIPDDKIGLLELFRKNSRL